MAKRPNSRRNLDMAIRRLGDEEGDYERNRFLITNAIVGQMLLGAVVKGGAALKFRYGEEATRTTTDLDIAISTSVEKFLETLDSRLREGWEGFTGRLELRPKAHPDGVPSAYVMQPCEIKLSYLGVPWCTVHLEIGPNEIGDADESEMMESRDAKDLLAALGFPAPGPTPLMLSEYQIAQKLHASSEPGSMRAHDLVDLQIILKNEDIELGSLSRTCERLFAYRGRHHWPPTVTSSAGWKDLYSAASRETDAVDDLDDALRITNDLIEELTDASTKGQ